MNTPKPFTDTLSSLKYGHLNDELVRPHKILEDAVNAVWTEIEQKTGMTVFNGSI